MALHYAAAGASSALLLKLRTDTFLARGASISFLSAFANEEEILFPPLTYLKPTGKQDEVTLERDGEPCTVTIFEVVPHLGGA